MSKGIDQAVLLAGSQTKLAEMLGVKQQAVSKWVRAGHVPLMRAIEIEAQLGVRRDRLLHPRLANLLMPDA